MTKGSNVCMLFALIVMYCLISKTNFVYHSYDYEVLSIAMGLPMMNKHKT